MKITKIGKYKLLKSIRRTDGVNGGLIESGVIINVTQIDHFSRKIFATELLDWKNWDLPVELVNDNAESEADQYFDSISNLKRTLGRISKEIGKGILAMSDDEIFEEFKLLGLNLKKEAEKLRSAIRENIKKLKSENS